MPSLPDTFYIQSDRQNMLNPSASCRLQWYLQSHYTGYLLDGLLAHLLFIIFFLAAFYYDEVTALLSDPVFLPSPYPHAHSLIPYNAAVLSFFLAVLIQQYFPLVSSFFLPSTEGWIFRNVCCCCIQQWNMF